MSSRRLLAALSSALLLPLLACTPPPLPGGDMPSVRADLEQIPAPTKSRYLMIKSLDNWENPYLTVQDSMLSLHVTLGDTNTTGIGTGGVLRPVGARRQTLNVRLSDLPAAIQAIPHDAWPYGRVIAIEEAHGAPRTAEPALRRNMEASLKTLADCGVVAYEWQDGGGGLK